MLFLLVLLWSQVLPAFAQADNTCIIPDSTVTVEVACGCFYWQGANYTQSGTYSTTITSSTGGDSLLRLVLTIITPDSSFNTVNACQSYDWNGMQYTASGRYIRLIPRYTVGCDSVAVLDLTILPLPASPVVQVAQPTCYVPTGTLHVAAPAGEGISYSLDSVNFQFSSDFTGLQPGSYLVYTQNGDGCTSIASTVTVSPVPESPSVPVADILQPACSGMTGSISVTAPLRSDYLYSIDNGTYQTGRNFSGLSAGMHTVTVIDSNGCTSVLTFAISQPAVLNMNVNSGGIACFGGTTTVTVSAQGGTAPYTGTGIYSVIAGTYAYTVTDARGCSVSRSFTVNQPALLVSTSASTPISCNGGFSTVTVSATGGTAPYAGTGTFNVPAGTYTYTVTDAGGCISTTSVFLTQPPAINVMATASTIACFGGTATVTIGAVGGVSPYAGTGTYTVSAGTYDYTVTDAAGCNAVRTVVVNQPPALNAYATSPGINCFGQTTTVTVTASGGTAPYTGAGTYTVPAGPYTYTVTDARGCTAGAGIIITQPSTLTASASVTTPLTCSGGTAAVNVAAMGGTAPYTGTGSFAQPAGTTTYTVIDNNGCTATVSQTLTQPSAILATVVVTNATCTTTGSATVSASGGTSPYRYLWSNGATAATATGLTPGSYSVVVTDNAGCSGTFSCTVRLNGTAPGLAGSITGQTTVRANATFTYSILPVSGATSYRWTLPPNCTGTSTTNSINVTYLIAFTGGSICVTPVNGCGDGGTSCKAVSIPTISGGGGGKVKDRIPTGLGIVTSGDSGATADGGLSVELRDDTVNTATDVQDASAYYSDAGKEDIRNLVAYPNPSRGKIVIGFNGVKDKKYILQLNDMYGNLVANLEVVGQEEMCQILYDTSILAKGTYNLSVTRSDGGQRKAIKIVVQ
jgi:hypothetical protein